MAEYDDIHPLFETGAVTVTAASDPREKKIHAAGRTALLSSNYVVTMAAGPCDEWNNSIIQSIVQE